MVETAIHPPRTTMDVFKMLPAGTLAEVIDNALYIMPSPSASHQRISLKLSFGLHDFVEKQELGEIFYAPLDVYLDETSNAVEPEILFIAKNNRLVIDEIGHLHGVPDLIVEILSQGNENHDKIRKKDLYEKFGVKEFWIVDPQTKKALGYKLDETRYQSLGEFIGKIRSNLLQQEFTF